MSIQNCHKLNSPAPERALVQKVRQLEEQIERLKQDAEAEPVYRRHELSEPLRKFIDSNVLYVHISDLNGRIYEVNEAATQLLGYSREELESGKVTWRDITPAEYKHCDVEAIRQLKLTGKTRPFRKEYIRKDGKRQPVLIGVSFVDPARGLCMAYALDVSQSVRLEKELRQSEQRLKLLADAIPQIVWITDHRGHALYSNQRFFDFSGFDPENTEPLQWISLIHPEEREGYLEYAREASKTRAPFERDARWRSADGSYRWQLIRGVPIIDEETQSARWFGTCTDIDDQRRAADDVRESEARFRTLADAIPQVVFTTDKDGKINYHNHRWSNLAGLAPGESGQDAWRFLIHPDDLPRYLAGWRQALKTGDSYECEFRLKPVSERDNISGDAYKSYLARAVAVRDREGAVTKWFATWTEIAREEQEVPPGTL